MRSDLLLSVFFTALLLLTAGPPPVRAEGGAEPFMLSSFDSQLLEAAEQFQVWFRTEDLHQDETTVGGTLVIAVANNSDVAVTELSLRIADLSASPCGHLPVFMGDLSAGQTKEMLVPFLTTREDWMNPQLPQEPVWQLEYIDQAGTQAFTQVLGQSSGGGL